MIRVTPDAEALMAYCARVSSPHQESPDYAKLLRFCIKKKHWSVFEHASMTIEIVTSRAISQQIVRHRSFTFQEFSQRYAGVDQGGRIPYDARRQAKKNRQSSVDDMDPEVVGWFEDEQQRLWDEAYAVYEAAIEEYGVATECARFILPLATRTKLYMTGLVRNWIHYIDLRTEPNVQFEHREIAEGIRTIFINEFPVTSDALDWGHTGLAALFG